ncbi:MAG: hypothetical protein KDE31_31950, partial [Caldilineaceae bacterium]|nr:hypothetical protein [Caldilineaceae bacterium]
DVVAQLKILEQTTTQRQAELHDLDLEVPGNLEIAGEINEAHAAHRTARLIAALYGIKTQMKRSGFSGDLHDKILACKEKSIRLRCLFETTEYADKIPNVHLRIRECIDMINQCEHLLIAEQISKCGHEFELAVDYDDYDAACKQLDVVMLELQFATTNFNSITPKYHATVKTNQNLMTVCQQLRQKIAYKILDYDQNNIQF